MRLRSRLMLLIGVAALVPLGIVGIGATQVSTSLMRRTVTDSQARVADELASHVDLWLSLQLDTLVQQAQSFRLEKLSDKKLEAFQRLVFQHSSDVHIVSVLTSEGADLAPSLYLTVETGGRLSSKEVVSAERFARFRASLPMERVREMKAQQEASQDSSLKPSITVGRPYVPDGRGDPVVPVVVRSNATGDVVLAVEMALDVVSERFEGAMNKGLDVALLDGSGVPVIRRGAGLIDAERFTAFLQGASCADVVYRSKKGVEVVGACAGVADTGWLLVVAEPIAAITAGSEKIENRTWYIALVAIVLSVVLGLAFSRPFSSQVTRVKDAALAVAEGNLGLRVSLGGPKEIRDLSRAFNFMSTRLARNRAEIEEKQAAIDEFNQELQRRLDLQEIELTETNRRLIQSARLAAVGEMGAGLAHELNNPLAGILGLVQVLRMKQGPGSATLADIEEQAQRCRQIVEHLLRFSREGTGGRTLDREDWSVVDLGEVINEVVTLVAGPFRSAGVDLQWDVGEGIRIRCDREAIGQAMVQLLNSIRATCDAEGSVMIRAESTKKTAEVTVRAASGSLAVGADDWMAQGMGFWLARQVIAEHGGRFDEPVSTDGDSEALWRLTLPVV